MFRPLTSWNPARTEFTSPVAKSTRKLKLPYGVSRWTAMVGPLGSGGSARGRGGDLADAEDDELRRLGGRDADDADQPAVVQVVGGHRGGVAADEEALLGLGAEQCARAPFVEQEALDGVAHGVPKRRSVDLEDHPLGALVDGLLQVVEVAPDREVPPLRVVGDGAGAPYQESRPREE